MFAALQHGRRAAELSRSSLILRSMLCTHAGLRTKRPKQEDSLENSERTSLQEEPPKGNRWRLEARPAYYRWAKPQWGNTIEYRLVAYFDDGEIFSHDQEDYNQRLKKLPPRETILGKDFCTSGFLKHVMDMHVGETRYFRMLPKDGFGPHRDDLVFKLDREWMPQGIAVGKPMLVGKEEQFGFITHVAEDGSYAILDANHRAAGRPVNYIVTLLSIYDKIYTNVYESQYEIDSNPNWRDDSDLENWRLSKC
eukprot:Clim_evm30s167 gene=Clim_evmTU30s167